MLYDDFKNKLQEFNLDMHCFAEQMGITYSAVTKWKYSSTPTWVDEYFKLLEENKSLSEFKTQLKEFCSKI